MVLWLVLSSHGTMASPLLSWYYGLSAAFSYGTMACLLFSSHKTMACPTSSHKTMACPTSSHKTMACLLPLI
jgi:hypothetical protein